MNIVHLTNSTTTGAYAASVKIHNILLEKGHNSKLYAKYARIKHKKVENIFIQSKYKGYILNIRDKFFTPLLKNILYYKQNNPKDIYCFYQINEYNKNGINTNLVKILPNDIDILFVHWVSGFVNTWDVLEIQRKTRCKVIYTMMDMAPITGGCHYSMSCVNYNSNCLNCPALPFDKKFIPFVQLKDKALNILKTNAKLLTFSENDINIAKNSHIKFSDYLSCILPFDVNLFRSGLISNNKNNKNKNEFHILSCAFSTNNIRKGPNYFFESLVQLDKITTTTIYIHNVNLNFEFEYNFKNIKFIYFNFSNNIINLIDLYKKIDILVFTSIADAGPQMIFEALLSGIPVVSFDVGYAKQLITNNWNGFVVDIYNTEQLALKILDTINLINNNKIDRISISNHALDYYSNNSFESKLNKILNL